MDRFVGPTGLPVEEVIAPLRAALAGRGLAVLQAPPGAGKTTVVPQRLLDEPWLDGARIIVLEPRRLAARAAAGRMASLLREPVGRTVGYVTRDDRKVSAATRIEVVTEGILTRRLQHDPSLAGTGLVVLDEVHERNLQGDLALALLLDIRPALRPDLRILAMSATIAAGRFAAVLGSGDGPAPVIASEGRTYPVDVRWLPAAPRSRVEDNTVAAVRRVVRDEPGDILVFLPGAGTIHRVEAALNRADTLPPDIDVRPLFGAMPAEAQDAALAPSPAGRRRVVLATDIAETSLTVAGVRVVVDAGLRRSPRFDPRTGITRLQTGAASKSSADQRAGRAGRTEPGVAYRLWSKLEQATRRPFPEPEITVVDLASLALELAVWGAAPGSLSFLDPPPPRALAEANSLLAELGAIDSTGRPTPRGAAMAGLPLHPRLARMVVDAHAAGLGWEACALAALLEDRDVLRGRPDELPTDVAERLRLITDDRSRHPQADRGALAGARRRARQLARRIGTTPGAADIEEAGRILALAYPDRIAQARGRGRVRLRGGGGAWVPETDPLADEPMLVVAELDAGAGKADARVRMGAAVHLDDVLAAAGADVEEATTVAWDPGRDDLRRRTERRLGILVLGSDEGRPEPGEATTAALLNRVRATHLGVLRWTDGARGLQARAAFLRSIPVDDSDEWPDLSDEALLATLDDWLAPMLPGATSRRDLERLDVHQALLTRLGFQRRTDLDRLAPNRVDLDNGRRLTLSYDDGPPAASARVQDLYGTQTQPTVADGAVPVVVTLLSPAGRPVQVTADLPGFWTGSWAEVRKEMAGRYPKHPWPEDPANTPPPPPRAPRRRA
ncbi:MAG TPA: ATP-dependent helicase HrpB [Acidimicrobiales bacterium]